MPISAINTSATKKYVSEYDDARDDKGNPTDDATVWEIGAVDSYVEAHATSKASKVSLKEGVNPEDLKGMAEAEQQSNVDYNVDVYTMAIEICRVCIKGWSNFKDHEGNEIEFKTKKTQIKGKMYEAVDSDTLAMIPKDVLVELYIEINKLSNLSEKQVKN